MFDFIKKKRQRGGGGRGGGSEVCHQTHQIQLYIFPFDVYQSNDLYNIMRNNYIAHLL